MFMTICIVSEDGLSHICTLTPLQHCPARLCQMVSNKCIARSIASRVMTQSNVVGMLSPCIQSFSMHSQAEQQISATVGNAVRAYSSRSAHLYARNAKHCFNLCLSSVIGLVFDCCLMQSKAINHCELNKTHSALTCLDLHARDGV